MQNWVLTIRIIAAYLVVGMALASVWAFRSAAGAPEQPTTRWHKLAGFVIVALTSPLLLLGFAVFALWTWDLWGPMMRAEEMEAKESLKSGDP